MPGIFTFFSLVLAASALVGSGVAALTWLWPGPRTIRTVPVDALSEPRVFCFRDGYLVSPDRGTGFLLPQPVNRLTAWDDLTDALSALIPGAEGAMDVLAKKNEPFHLQGQIGRDKLFAVGLRDGNELRVSLSTSEEGQEAIRVDARILGALEAENVLLTESHRASPCLAWVLNADNQVIWANGPYQDEVIQCLGPESAAAWPIPNLFPDQDAPPVSPVRRALGGTNEQDPVRWYEVEVCPSNDGIRHAHAQPLNRVIAAEDNLRSFINTLTQTFTALPTGLAIFDAQRQLVLFNPPLVDMTGLNSGWLAGRPHLSEVLDTLRETQALPEPRDWKAWRDRLIGADGPFNGAPWSESWTLASGQSFRMTARPQSDGTVAILLEDITAERAVARKQQSTQSVLAALLDSSRDAYAVFDPDFAVTHINSAMHAIVTVGSAPPPRTLDALLRPLALRYRPTSLWNDVRQHMLSGDPRTDWTEEVELQSGAEQSIIIRHLPDGHWALVILDEQSRQSSRANSLVPHTLALGSDRVNATARG